MVLQLIKIERVDFSKIPAKSAFPWSRHQNITSAKYADKKLTELYEGLVDNLRPSSSTDLSKIGLSKIRQ